MNFFFGLKDNLLTSNLSIPVFNNNGEVDNNLSIFSAKPLNNEWKISKLDLKIKDYFYFLNNEIIDNNEIYFLARENEFDSYKKKLKEKLLNFNNFTSTSPVSYRSNLKIKLLEGGTSSYQSDYPYSMTLRKGNILSPIKNLLSKEADKNFILFRNIYYLPIQENSKIYFLDLKKGEILHDVLIKSNYSNLIEVSNKLLNKNIYLFSENCLGIPVYISIKNKHLSLEHTHPPHHYILGKDKFDTVNKLKKRAKDIVNLDV